MTDYVPEFDLPKFEELDQFELFTRQDNNLGNSTDWFGMFRSGTNKPARTNGVTVETELLLSRAYIPIRTQLLSRAGRPDYGSGV